MTGFRRNIPKARWFITALIGTAAAWVIWDLYGPRQVNLRRFDPHQVARVETAMWRSYYGRRQLLLFSQLAELLRTQYHLPFFRSNVVAYKAARAAFVFKEGHTRSDYERALPLLVDYYAALREMSDTPFNVDRAARLELEWWIVHRERESHQPEDLERALSEIAAEVYRVPSNRVMEHGRLRAEAMRLCDTKAEPGGLREEDWAKIEELLRASWAKLWEVVNS